MKYTFQQFKAEYPDDDACLEAVFQNRYGDLTICPKCGVTDTKFFRIKNRKCYSCMHCGYHIYPLKDTIFAKSSTSLWNWFYAIYLFSVAKNGISAKELERHLGVTYKCAWRMARQIRILMAEDNAKLMGIVEADETYMGGRREMDSSYDNKTPIVGVAEKRGLMKAKVIDKATREQIYPFLIDSIEPLSVLHTDQSQVYHTAKSLFKHRKVNHGYKHYVDNGVHTNNLEGFWSQLKRSADGTYHVISPKYLQHYVDEFVFRYNHRFEPVCPVLLARIGKRI